MIQLALSEPDEAAFRWQWLLDTDGGKHVAQPDLNVWDI